MQSFTAKFFSLCTCNTGGVHRRIVRRNVPEPERHDKAGYRMAWFGPAHAANPHLPGPGATNLPTDAIPRGQAEITLAGSLAPSGLALAETGLAPDHGRTNRLTLELSGSINREAIDLSA